MCNNATRVLEGAKLTFDVLVAIHGQAEPERERKIAFSFSFRGRGLMDKDMKELGYVLFCGVEWKERERSDG